VRTRLRRNPECRQLLSVKSMMRYRPPKGTAGLARSAVSGCRRDPTPPARMILMVLSCMGTSTQFQRMLPALARVFSFQPGELCKRFGLCARIGWHRDRFGLFIVELV